MLKKLLAVIAHPDDETFGFGGTLAKYAEKGVDIHVLCATRGEEGETTVERNKLGKIREAELLAASDILGVNHVEFLDYHDGTLCNKIYHEVAAKVEAKIKSFEPDIVITFDEHGVSGHLDHIFMSLVTTFVCRKYKDILKLFYYCELNDFTPSQENYFIYFPPGHDLSEVDVIIDTDPFWEQKTEAMYAHASQMHDVTRILSLKKDKQFHRECFLQAFKTTSLVTTHTEFPF